MTFVDLQEHHCPVLAKHYVETYNSPPWNDEWTEPLAAEKLKEIMDSSGSYGLVCYDDASNFAGAILGNSETYFNCKHFFIKDFFVSLSLQGKGIGSLLMAELEKRLAAKGITKTYLFTSKGDQTEGFYNRRGYTTWEGMVMMGKSI